jgi:hypothetical protein
LPEEFVAPAGSGTMVDLGRGVFATPAVAAMIAWARKHRAPIVRAPAARPRERRTQATTKRSGRSRDGPESDLPAPRLTRAQRLALKHEISERRCDTLRREVRLNLESGAP